MVTFCGEHNNKLTIQLHIQPRAKKTRIVGMHGDSLKMKVAAPPVDGAANEEIIDHFSKFLKIPKHKISIKVGTQSKAKILEVWGITLAEFINILLKEKVLGVLGAP